MTPNPKLFELANKIGNGPPNMNLFLFEHAVEMLTERPAPLLEIGTDWGGSALLFMDALHQTKADTFLVTVDPWGNKPYPTGRGIYGDDRQRHALSILSQCAETCGIRWHHFKMRSMEFLESVQHLGCWYGGNHFTYEWGLAFLDGEHIWETVRMEIEALKMAPGSHIIIDDAIHAQPEGPELQQLLSQNYNGEMFHYNDTGAIFTVEVAA